MFLLWLFGYLRTLTQNEKRSEVKIRI